MKKLLAILAGLAALLVAAAAILPERIDWDAQRADIAAGLSAATGQPLELGGPLRFRLLPVPALTVEQVTLGTAPLLRLARLEARVALLPLLGGRIEVESLVLHQPLLALEPLPLPATPAPAAATIHGPLAKAIRLERVEIHDGTLVWRQRDGGEERLSAIEATLSAASLSGPFQLQGQFQARGASWNIEAASGAWNAGGPTPLRLALAVPAAKARFAGILTGSEEGESRFQGDLRMEGRSLGEAALPLLGASLPPALHQAFNARALVSGTARTIDFTGLELQLGETTAAGSARLTPGTPPAVELRLAASRLDLDSWLDPWLSPAPAAGAAAVAFVLPADLRARLDLAVEAAGLWGGLLRQVRLEAQLAGGIVTVERLAALAPGGSALMAGGTLAASGGRPVVDASLEVSIDNLRSALEWLRIDAGAVPAERLRRLGFIGHFHGRPDDFQLSGVDLQLDTSRLTGGLAWRNQGRPALGLRAELDHLDLDGYHPPGTEPPGPPTALLPVLMGLLRRGDANLALRVGSLTSGGATFRGLELEGTANHGTLALRSARIGNLEGIGIALHGTVQGLEPLSGADLTLEASSTGLGTVERLFGWTLPLALRRAGALRLDGRLSGDAGRLGVEATLAALGGSVQAGGTLGPLPDPLAQGLKLRLTLPETGRLVRVAAPEWSYAADPGATDLYGELAAAGGQVRLTALQGMLAGASLKGELRAGLDGPRPRLEAELTAGELALDRMLPGAAETAAPRRPSLWPGGSAADRRRGWSPDPLPFAALRALDGRLTLEAAAATLKGRRFEAPKLTAKLEDGTLELERLEAGLLGGQMLAEGRATTPAGQAPAVNARLQLSRLQLEPATFAAAGGGQGYDLAGGIADGELALRSSGKSPLALMKALGGDGRFAIVDGRLSGIDLGGLTRRIAEIRRPQDLVEVVTMATSEGQTPFQRLEGSATIDKGIVTSRDLRLEAESGTGEAEGWVVLVSRTLDAHARFRLRHDPPLPPLGMTLSGGLDHPRRSYDTREVQSWLAQRLTGAVLRQLKPEAAPGAIPTTPGGLFQGLIRKLPHSI